MDSSLILEGATLISIVILGFLVKNYLPKYFSEKAKNLATKEDIAGITEKIESVKSNYATSLEKIKAELQVRSALQQAFHSKCLEALISINDLLVELHLYCWKNIAERSPAEHYVWEAVNNSENGKGLHYYQVALDKLAMENSLYLTNSAKLALSDLAVKIGLISNLELNLSMPNPDPIFENSAVSNYESAIEAIDECREKLVKELSLASEN